MPKLLTARAAPRILPWLNPPIDTGTLITDTEKPVESFYIERQQTLLTDLRDCWTAPGGGHFECVSNVGVFFEDDPKHPLVPDAMLTLDFPEIDPASSDSRSFFTWIVGKVPDAVIEIVSPEPAGEDSEKMRKYEARGIPNYVVFDPYNALKEGMLRSFRLVRKKYRPNGENAFPELGLALGMWEGPYAGWDRSWLRWFDLKGEPIPIARELADRERRERRRQRRRADAEKARADDQEKRAGSLKKQADNEKARADAAEAKLRELAAKLRELGLEPPA